MNEQNCARAYYGEKTNIVSRAYCGIHPTAIVVHTGTDFLVTAQYLFFNCAFFETVKRDATYFLNPRRRQSCIYQASVKPCCNSNCAKSCVYQKNGQDQTSGKPPNRKQPRSLCGKQRPTPAMRSKAAEAISSIYFSLLLHFKNLSSILAG